MIFEVYSIQPATNQNVNGVDQFTHNPTYIEGKGKYVKIMPDSNNIITGDDRLTTDYNPFVINNTIKATINLIDLPNELYLAEGKKLYLSTLITTNRVIIKVLHYDKGKSSSIPTGFTGTIDITPKP